MGTAFSYSKPPGGQWAVINGFSFIQRRLMGLERLPATTLSQIHELENTALSFEPGADIIVEADMAGGLHIQAQGWACRYQLLENGRRQILDFVLPGDWFDLIAQADEPYTASVGALTACRSVAAPPGFMQTCKTSHPKLLDAIETMRGETIRRLEESVTTLGQRTAPEAMLLFLSRTYDRLRAVGLADGRSAAFPLTQEMIGDHLGLSTVHVNRTLKKLREEWGIRIANNRLTIAEPDIIRGVVPDTPPPFDRLPRRLLNTGLHRAPRARRR